jgi:hypothetical protein
VTTPRQRHQLERLHQAARRPASQTVAALSSTGSDDRDAAFTPLQERVDK